MNGLSSAMPGKSLNFRWLQCAVLLLLVLFGSLLVGYIQKWLVTSESIWGLTGGYHRSLRAILCLGDEYLDVESDTCQKCPVCPYGYKLNKACGSGLGADATCSHCTSDYYQRDGECYPCKFCQGREILEKCTNTSNTKCSSQCMEGYYMAVNKQCIQRFNQRPRPAPSQKATWPTSSKSSISTTADKVAITAMSPPSIIKVQNESNSEVLFPEHTTPSVTGKVRHVSVSPPIFAVLFFGTLLLVVVLVCILKGNFISLAVLKAQIYGCCCCEKNKQPAETDEELGDAEDNSTGTSAESLEAQNSQPLLPDGDMQVFISTEDIEDDAFVPEIEHEKKGTDKPEMQKQGSDDQDEGEMKHRFADIVIFISRALAKEDLESLKYYLHIAISNDFTESDKESVDSFEKIATVLQQRLICSWSNTGILVKGLRSINRHDLAQKLEKLDKLEKSEQPRRLRRSSSRQD